MLKKIFKKNTKMTTENTNLEPEINEKPLENTTAETQEIPNKH